MIEILILESRAQQALGNLRGALELMARALSGAEQEGYRRVFLDEGPRLRDLLRHAVARGVAGGYARQVLAAFDAPRPATPAASATGVPALVQPLTSRELEILRLIAAGLRNQEIADHLGTRLTDVEVSRFADGEIFVKINENVRGRDVFIVQATNPPADNLMELLLLMDAARRASAHRIAAVLPYYGYARADRKDQPRVAISSKLVANMLVHAGAERVITMLWNQ